MPRGRSLKRRRSYSRSRSRSGARPSMAFSSRPGRRISVRHSLTRGANSIYKMKRGVIMPAIIVPTPVTGSLQYAAGVVGTGLFTVPAGSTNAGFECTPNLGDVSGFAKLTALFDMYKLRMVVYEIAFFWSGASPSLTSQAMPYLLYARDYDNTGVPASYPALEEYANTKRFWFGDGDRRLCRIGVRPMPQTVEADPGQSVTGPPNRRCVPWINCAFPTLLHYGLRGFFVNPSSATYTFQVRATYYLTFKGII